MCEGSKNARSVHELAHAYRAIAPTGMLIEAASFYTKISATNRRACEVLAELDRRVEAQRPFIEPAADFAPLEGYAA